MSKPTHARVGARGEHRDATKTFLKLFEQVSRREGWREYEAFQKWLTCGAAALANPALRLAGMKDAWDRNEARYMAVVNSCRDDPRPTMDDFSQALAIAAVALQEDPTDFLGPIFTEVAASSAAGQFFTPYDVSVLMARMTIGETDPILDEVRSGAKPWIRLQEPACGVGGMILAANAVLKERGLDPSRHAKWWAIDVDWNAFCGCYIQASLTDAAAWVIHGNTLSVDVWESYPTFAMASLPAEAEQLRAQPAFEGPKIAAANSETVGKPSADKGSGFEPTPAKAQLDFGF